MTIVSAVSQTVKKKKKSNVKSAPNILCDKVLRDLKGFFCLVFCLDLKNRATGFLGQLFQLYQLYLTDKRAVLCVIFPEKTFSAPLATI